MSDRPLRHRATKVKQESVRDRPLKEVLLKHFWAQRCFVQPEIDVRFFGGISSEPKLLTDIDVFVLRPHPDLYFERVLGDCRGLRGQSPVARVLWLKGVMDFLAARTGVVLLGGSPRIEQDHKLVASRSGIRLLSEPEFRAYDKAVVYPEGSERVPISIQEIQMLREVGKRFVKLEPLVTYAYRDAWLESSFGDVIRHSIGHLKAAARELDPSKVEHVALFCDVAAVFSVGLAECAGQVFHQYLQPAEKEVLADSLRGLLWGGREQYQFFQTLRQKALEARGRELSELPPLELPAWNQFVQLVRNLLERPVAAFDLPWLLRRLALDINRQWEPLKYARRSDSVALKAAMLVLEYLVRASGVPSEFGTIYEKVLVRTLSRLAIPVGVAPRAAGTVVGDPTEIEQRTLSLASTEPADVSGAEPDLTEERIRESRE